ncbi:MAG: protein kinase [Candidatus Sumerlaeota bacterium]|nr:protein kinase [Candidatus Sumerlaeota bacterium]
MKKLIKFISMLVGLALIGWIAFSWQALVKLGEAKAGEGMGIFLAVAAVVFAFVAALLLHTLVLRLMAAPTAISGATPEKRRLQAEQMAAEAIEKKRFDMAIQYLEDAGLYGRALEVAEKWNDFPSQARLSLRMGAHARARKLYVQIGDYAGAGHVSLLMNETKDARDLYAKAALACQERHGKALEQAALWDRAHDFAQAAQLYEEAAELPKASECYEILGDHKNATRCADQSKAVHAMERKLGGLTSLELDRHAERRKTAALKAAEETAAQGDFFRAGENYQTAGKMMEAAIAFERAEQWRRAANAYKAAGLEDRAELARMRAEAETPESVEETDEEREAAAAGLAAPKPGSIPGRAFNPLTQVKAIPVYLAASGQEILDAAAQEEMVRFVRQGRFPEAAEKASKAGNWSLAGAFYECGGSLIKAADTYRQIGRVDEAVECLSRAGRTRDAAMMLLAEGKQDRAIQALLAAIESNQSVEDAGSLLEELLVDWGKIEEAVALLKSRIAPGGVTPGNAALYYRFARLLESKEYLSQALALYKEIIASGADSEDIRARQKRLEDALAIEAPSSGAGKTRSRTMLNTEQEAAIEGFLTKAIQSAPAQPAETKIYAPAAEGAGVTGTFAFSFVESGANPWDAWQSGASGAGAMGASVSLFGSPQKPLPDGAAAAPGVSVAAGAPAISSASALSGPSAASGASSAAADPFDSSRRYQQIREIARGGMGVVYEAVDNILARSIALKLILDSGTTRPEDLQQFLLEARAIAQLSHPNVVMIYDIGLMGLRHYIAMELVKGGNLSKLIKDEKQLPIDEALRLFVEIARGLQAAHEAGIVHRDIKPGNILLTDKRQVKIVDFGLAKLSQKGSDLPDKTIMRSSGTPGYMAPEQIRGEKMLPRADIYALGITLFDMLVGKPPHKLTNITNEFDILKFQIDGILPSLKAARPDVPDALDKLFRFCTAANPEERYQTVDAFLETAEKWLHKLKG